MISFLSGAKKTLTTTLIVVLFAGSTSLFVAPRPAHAVLGIGDISFDPSVFFEDILSYMEEYASGLDISNLSLDSETDWTKEYVLDPIAWGVAQGVLQSITGSVVKFVNGQANGTGAAMFVTNLQANLQRVGNSVAGVLPGSSGFIAQFSANLGSSPFASSIAASLKTNYLQGTSLAGFWAANQCTLTRSSPNVNKFLAGDWSQGGAAAWFALTTQDQNNPYTLYQKSQSELGSMVNNAQAARSSQINNGQGFLSWCGNVSGAISDATGIDIADPCTNRDGSPGIIQTPGIVIQSQLAKALGSGVDKLVAADEMSEILTQVVASFVTDVLSGGLAPGSSVTGSYLASNPAPKIDVSSQIQKKTASINQYTSDWNTIRTTANTASASVTDLADYCSTQKISAQRLLDSGAGGTYVAILTQFINTASATITSAQSTLTGTIAPVLAQATQANVDAENVRTMALRIQAEANSMATSTDNGATLAADISAFLQMKPTNRDLSDSHQKAQTMTNGVLTASPPGSLNIDTSADPSLVNLMNLIDTNAKALKLSCIIPQPS